MHELGTHGDAAAAWDTVTAGMKRRADRVAELVAQHLTDNAGRAMIERAHDPNRGDNDDDD